MSEKDRNSDLLEKLKEQASAIFMQYLDLSQALKEITMEVDKQYTVLRHCTLYDHKVNVCVRQYAVFLGSEIKAERRRNVAYLNHSVCANLSI